MRNFFKRKLPNLLLSFILVFSMLMPEVAFAGSRSVPMYLTVTEEPIEFNISETITMTGTEGNTDLTVSPVAISNTGKKDMTVSSMAITTEGGYTLVSTASDFTTASANFVGISCKDHEFSSGAYEPYDDVLVGGSISYTLKGKISSIAPASTATAAKMVVTLEKAVPGYVLYESGSTGSNFGMTFSSGAYDGTMEYSNNGVSWQTVTQGTEISSKNGKLYLRGTGNTYCTGGSSGTGNPISYSGMSGVKVSGNIESLLDYKKVKAGGHPAMGKYAFQRLFGYTDITDASELLLPATTLAEGCYYYMFNECTSLTTAPELPATNLAERCYDSMFEKCTSLTTAPELPATTLKVSCYHYMFNGCKSLTTPPELPATTLAAWCYNNMFQGCKGIKLSTTKTGEYTISYRIPTTGTITDLGFLSVTSMFTNTGGTFTGTPDINTTYYLASN